MTTLKRGMHFTYIQYSFSADKLLFGFFGFEKLLFGTFVFEYTYLPLGLRITLYMDKVLPYTRYYIGRLSF